MARAPYEQMRDKIQRERYKTSLRQVRKEKRRTLSDKELAELIEKEGVSELMNEDATRIDKFKVMARYEVSEWKARNAIKLLQRLR